MPSVVSSIQCLGGSPVKRKNKAARGEYRTKRVILEIYDATQQATETGQPYQTLLNPPPADPRVVHPPRDGDFKPLKH